MRMSRNTDEEGLVRLAVKEDCPLIVVNWVWELVMGTDKLALLPA
jgi:hypothetical protein